MKKLTLFIIIVVHLVVLSIVMGPCSGSRSHPEDGQPPPDTAPADSDNDNADLSPVEDDSVVARTKPYDSHTFSISEGELPVAIAGQTDVCRTGAVVDWTAKKVLWQKAASTSVPIASLTKMMTAWVVTEALHADKNLTLQTPVKVTVEASKIGGRQVWLDPRESFTVDELLKCVMIRSANDCAYLLAQYVGGGDHAAFVARMNSEAGKLGLNHFHFYNSHGLPPDGTDRENCGNALELAYLAGLLLGKPEVIKWSSTRLEYIRENAKPFQLVSTNKLLERVPGVNGMKTGYTKASGYCIVVTCERNGREMVVVVTGCLTGKARDALAEALLGWAYSKS